MDIIEEMQRPITTVEDRFWSRVKKTSKCWEWQGTKLKTGYGVVSIKGKNIRAHRIAYELTKGKIPQGYGVCHTCDNPSCVKPDHLWIGTHKENMEDRNKKGGYLIETSDFIRNLKIMTKGGRPKQVNKVLIEKRKEIMVKLLQEGFSRTQVAFIFSVHPAQVTRVLVESPK